MSTARARKSKSRALAELHAIADAHAAADARKTAADARRAAKRVPKTLKAVYTTADLADARKRNERTELQLAGCAVAALGGGPIAKPADYGWSPAYQDVLDLRRKYEQAVAERAALWALLDDIDTLDDSARDNDKAFRDRTRQYQKMRHFIDVSEYELAIGRKLLTHKKKPSKKIAKPTKRARRA